MRKFCNIGIYNLTAASWILIGADSVRERERERENQEWRNVRLEDATKQAVSFKIFLFFVLVKIYLSFTRFSTNSYNFL